MPARSAFRRDLNLRGRPEPPGEVWNPLNRDGETILDQGPRGRLGTPHLFAPPLLFRFPKFSKSGPRDSPLEEGSACMLT